VRIVHRFLPLVVLAAASVSSLPLALADETSDRPVQVEFETTEGSFVLELYPDKAPKTVANFLAYVESGHYDQTVFHRVIKDFMIQGGGMDTKLQEKDTRPPVRNESENGLKNVKFSVAMARTPDPHSATSQFFINTADNTFLNREEAQDGFGYTVFGKVVEGTEVVSKIGNAKTQAVPDPAYPARLMQDVPANPIVIKSAKVRKNDGN
jgi:cyclophilin family peptidyl-prolyl cis-trans isomerase